jgi:acyl-CoA thioesterase FadM
VTTREEIVTAAGELAAEAEAVLVARDPETGRSRPLSDPERAALERELAGA